MVFLTSGPAQNFDAIYSVCSGDSWRIKLISKQIEFQSKNWSRVTNFGVLKVFLLLSINSNGSNLFQTSRVISIRKIFFLIPAICFNSQDILSKALNCFFILFYLIITACSWYNRTKEDPSPLVKG